jgi:hypothetical protein
LRGLQLFFGPFTDDLVACVQAHFARQRCFKLMWDVTSNKPCTPLMCMMTASALCEILPDGFIVDFQQRVLVLFRPHSPPTVATTSDATVSHRVMLRVNEYGHLEPAQVSKPQASHDDIDLAVCSFCSASCVEVRGGSAQSHGYATPL